MKKKSHTFFFLIAATFVNLLILITCTVLLTSFFIIIYRNVEISTALSWIAVIIIIFGSIILTFLIYSRLVRWVTKKWSLDNHLEPIFSHKFRGGK